MLVHACCMCIRVVLVHRSFRGSRGMHALRPGAGLVWEHVCGACCQQSCNTTMWLLSRLNCLSDYLTMQSLHRLKHPCNYAGVNCLFLAAVSAACLFLATVSAANIPHSNSHSHCYFVHVMPKNPLCLHAVVDTRIHEYTTALTHLASHKSGHLQR